MNLRRCRKLLREHARYFLNNGSSGAALRRFSPQLIQKAYDFGYIHWPKHLQRHVKGRDVLDVGCGMGLHAVGFVLSGVRSYTGCDPIVDFDSDVIKNTRAGRREACGWTPRQITARFPQLRYVSGGIDDVELGRRFDVVTLHNTTEHLISIAEVFAALVHRLRPDGVLIFNHHNFYAWNGHHLAPKSISAIDAADLKQTRVLDWAHLEADAELSEYLSTRVNRITLDELRALTEQHYTVDEWQEALSNESEGRGRLTSEILERHHPLTRRDLATQSVYCVARPRTESRER